MKQSDGKRREKGKERKDKERNTRKRDYEGDAWEEDPELDTSLMRKRRREDYYDSEPGPSSSSRPAQHETDQAMEEGEEPYEDEETRRERERLEDLRDRDAFAERVKERDKDRQKKVVEDRSSKANAGAAAEAAERRRLADDAEARDQALPSLRLHSRQEYLTKRELQQIELLRKEIADEEALFSGMKMSKKEKRELERKKELLRLVEERLKINDGYDGYQLPEDYFTEQGKIDKKKKENALYKRYEEAKPKDGSEFITDVDQWEAAQTKHSTFKTGAMDKREIVEDYDYVFDESQTIQFVIDQASTLPGTKMTAAEKLLQDQIDAAEKRGELYHHIITLYRCFIELIFVSSENHRRDTEEPPYLQS